MSPTDIERWLALLEHTRTENPKRLREIFAEATSSISLDKYRSDPQLLNIWLEFLRLESEATDDPGEVRDKYKYLKSRVGATAGHLYLQWADFEEKLGFSDKAVSILQTGIKLGAQPISALKERLDQLLEHDGSKKLSVAISHDSPENHMNCVSKRNLENFENRCDSAHVSQNSKAPYVDADASVMVQQCPTPDTSVDEEVKLELASALKMDQRPMDEDIKPNTRKLEKNSPLDLSHRCFVVNRKTYWRITLVGRGASSKVYKVLSEDAKIYAMKKVKLSNGDAESIEGYINEINLLTRLRESSHIIRLIDSEIDRNAKCIHIVLEYGEIDLATLIAKHEGRLMGSNFVRLFWQQMLEAVQEIHNEGIIHSDLKPANFVIVEGSLKLIDFGIANAISQDTTNVHRDYQAGTLNYMSPEAIAFSDSGYGSIKLGRPSDVWSLGCILYQLSYGKPPFASLSTIQKLQCIVDKAYKITFEDLAEPLQLDAIKRCLIREPKGRPTIPELLKHPYLHPGHLKTPSDYETIHERWTKLSAGIQMISNMPQMTSRLFLSTVANCCIQRSTSRLFVSTVANCCIQRSNLSSKSGTLVGPMISAITDRSSQVVAEDPLIDAFVNNIMKDGKKATARRIVSDALFHIQQQRPGESARALLGRALEMVEPYVKVVSTKRGAKSIQTPKPLTERQRRRTAILWVVEAAKSRSKLNSMGDRIGAELLAALVGDSAALQKKKQVHTTALQNRSNMILMDRKVRR